MVENLKSTNIKINVALTRMCLIENAFVPVHIKRYMLYNWSIWRVLKLAFFSKKYFPCIYFGVWSSQNNAIVM